MSKRNDQYERNPWKMVLYIILVLLLLGSLVFLVYRTRQQKKAYQEQLQQMKSQETEYIRPERQPETETETETESEKKQQTSQSTSGKQTAGAASKAQSEKAAAVTTGSEAAESETESWTTGETTVTLDASEYLAHILLLNASGREGVAGAWRTELEKDGYKNVTIASYTGSAKEQTQIYVKKSRRKLTEHLQELFEGSQMNFDTFTDDFEMPDGASKPEDVDVYVLIGREDIPEE